MTTRRQPETFLPVREFSARRKLPDHLYVVVDDVVFATFDHQRCSVVTLIAGDLRATLSFTCQDLTQGNLRTHLTNSNSSTLKTKFISVFESKDTALQAHPFCAPIPTGQEGRAYRATNWTIDTSKLQAGWIDTPTGHVPVWLEHGDLPITPKNALYMKAEAIDAFDGSIWICLDEAREIFGLQGNEGERGEWLACGFIPRSMVAAQVVLQDCQRQLDLAHAIPHEPIVLSRSGSVCSIRSISSEEQEEHIKVQILRNKASRENLRRTKAATKRLSGGREQPLLRQAINNSQRILTKKESSETIESSSDTQMTPVEPQKEATILVAHADLVESFVAPSCYASIRSPLLREALERKEAPKSSKPDGVPMLRSSETTEMRKDWGVEDRLRQLSLLGSCEHDSDSRNSEVESLAQETDNLELLPHSERLRRARAGKRRADFYALSQNPGLQLGAKIEAGSNPKSDTESLMGRAADIFITFMDELERRRARRERPAAPEPSLLNEGGSSSEYAPSLTDEATPPIKEVHSYEADVSDNYDSASDCPPLRRTRRRSAHSRSTTPLSLYDIGPGHRPTRG